MNDLHNLLSLIKTLKGAPLSCIILLYLAPAPVSQRWLQRSSGFSAKPVRVALHRLREAGLAAENPMGWELSQNARLNFPLPAGLLAGLDQHGIFSPPSGIFSPQPININKQNKDSDSTPININSQVGKKDTSKTPLEPDPADYPEVTQAFQDCGIYLNRRTRLLLPHITSRDVRKAYSRLYNDGKQNETGILVTILEEIAAKNKREENHHLQRYADWEA